MWCLCDYFIQRLAPTVCVCSKTLTTPREQWDGLARRCPLLGAKMTPTCKWRRPKPWEGSPTRPKLQQNKRNWRAKAQGIGGPTTSQTKGTWRMPSKSKRKITKAKNRRSGSHSSPSKWTNPKRKPRSDKCGRSKFSSKSFARKKFPKIIHLNWYKFTPINKFTTSTMALRVQVQHAPNIL